VFFAAKADFKSLDFAVVHFLVKLLQTVGHITAVTPYYMYVITVPR